MPRRIVWRIRRRNLGKGKAVCRNKGFTLIELSIVLVIIGLIVGGILVGRDLVTSAALRAQITQIEKYNTAVNTFRIKFNAIPGDMQVNVATQYGFTIGSSCTGQQGGRDGNGLLDGYYDPYELNQGIGETALFWKDLSSPASGAMLEGFSPNGGGAYTCSGSNAPTLSNTMIGQYFPPAKLGDGIFVYVYETNGANWFGIAGITAENYQGGLSLNASIPVDIAARIDQKVDDDMPLTGNILANYVNNNVTTVQATPHNVSDTSSSCYNTGNSTYSIGYNSGKNPNCALSFKFQ
jgi:prepilin-type N-terminal cleavage/methylation domain-containing protein